MIQATWGSWVHRSLKFHFTIVVMKCSQNKSTRLGLHQFHAEAGGGQFEFALVYDTALRIADKLLLAREAITTAATSENLIATFLPK